MSFIKGLCLGLVGFLLFFSLPLWGLTLAAKSTLLDPQFMIAESARLDISTAAKEFLADQSLLDETYLTAVNRTLSDLEPWVKQQVNQIIRSSYNYWLGKNRTFDTTFDLLPLKQALVDNLTTVYRESPPAEYLALSPEKQAGYLARIKQDTLAALPDKLEINEELLGDDFPAINYRIRQVMMLTNSAFLWLTAGVIILVLLLMPVLREVKGTLRAGGIIFFLAGAIVLLFLLVVRSSLPQMYPTDLVPEVQIWIPMVISDVLHPGWLFGWILCGAGALFLCGSFFIRGRSSRL